MINKYKLITIIAALAISPLLTFGVPILSPSDSIIAIDSNDATSNSNHSESESPSKILDGNVNTYYRNHGGGSWDALYTGFIVTPSGSSTIQSFILKKVLILNPDPDLIDLGNPNSWLLYGTTDAITSTNNSNGTEENWTLIHSGNADITDPEDPNIVEKITNTTGEIVYQIINSTAYTSYRMIFPELKDGFDNYMNIADVIFFPTYDGSGINILSVNDDVIAVQAAPASKYPAGEATSYVIDGNINNKYLNFGKDNSGFIVTPNFGSSVVRAFEIWTADDIPGRDPTNWVLYGTTDTITSIDNSRGTAENWTLIDSGYITLPDERNAYGGMVAVSNSTPYTSYKMIFPEVKDPGGAGVNSMQIAEIQFDTIPEPTALMLLCLCGLTLLRRN